MTKAKEDKAFNVRRMKEVRSLIKQEMKQENPGDISKVPQSFRDSLRFIVALQDLLKKKNDKASKAQKLIKELIAYNNQSKDLLIEATNAITSQIYRESQLKSQIDQLKRSLFELQNSNKDTSEVTSPEPANAVTSEKEEDAPIIQTTTMTGTIDDFFAMMLNGDFGDDIENLSITMRPCK